MRQTVSTQIACARTSIRRAAVITRDRASAPVGQPVGGKQTRPAGAHLAAPRFRGRPPLGEPRGVSGEEEVVHRDDDAEAMRASLECPQAFELIFDRHHGVIWAYLARLGGRDRADELAGEVFLVAFARRASYDPTRGSVRSWLYGIASNLLRTRFRSDARAARAFRQAAARHRPVVVSIDGVEEVLAGRQRFDVVVAALGRLPAGDREIIVLFAWERLSYDEIATALGIEVGTVRSRLSRARGRLRELVAASGELTDEVT